MPPVLPSGAVSSCMPFVGVIPGAEPLFIVTHSKTFSAMRDPRNTNRATVKPYPASRLARVVAPLIGFSGLISIAVVLPAGSDFGGGRLSKTKPHNRRRGDAYSDWSKRYRSCIADKHGNHARRKR